MHALRFSSSLLLSVALFIASGCGCENSFSGDTASNSLASSQVIYRNPQVKNVDYSFELVPDPAKTDRAKDLKLWIPIPREWESQRAVKIVSVEPPAHAEYQDPEHGNLMLFWDFGKEPDRPSYKVDIKFRLESYEIHGEAAPDEIGLYDKTSRDYVLYTRSSHTIPITPKVKELAKTAVGNEKNPYLQAKRIGQFVRRRMRYKIIAFEKGERGIKPLLENPIVSRTGQEYYQGSCSEYSALFIALCRAVGIPARAVVGFVGWNPYLKEEDLRRHLPPEFEVSPRGLAGTQDYFPGVSPHQWAEFFVPDYGWVPWDNQPIFGRLDHGRVITSKGRDVMLGPNAPQEQSDGYGFQWVLINDGRVDALMTGVWNIAKIRTAKVKILHHSDPFPADGIAIYREHLYPEEGAQERGEEWRKGVLSLPSRAGRRSVPGHLNLEQVYAKEPSFRGSREAFVLHMLRRQLGNEKFSKLIDTYLDLRQESKQPISTSAFQRIAEDVAGESLDWFFNQWVNRTSLPRLRLKDVAAREDYHGWQVQGRLLREGPTAFRLPVELELVTKSGRERHEVWIDSGAVNIDLRTENEPQKLIVDPDYEMLKLQRMPPRLWWYWDVCPELVLVYGTVAETEANRTAAERLNDFYLGYGQEVIKADINVTEADLKTKCVMLFGRPSTNRVSQRSKDAFPIKFDGDNFTWHGTTYVRPNQGVAQVVDNPYNSKNLVILYAGLSGDATLKLFDFPSGKLGTDEFGWFPHEADASYYIYDGYSKLASGDWEDYESDLVSNFQRHPVDQKP